MNATMTAPGLANGRQRHTLNDSIARLDEMIDGLSEAIPATIRDTLKDAISESIAEGVRVAIVQVLSNRELQDALQPKPRRGLLGEKLRESIQRARHSVSRWVQNARTRVTAIPRRLGQRLRTVWGYRKPLLIALGIGTVVGIVAAWTPPWFSATISGLGSAAVSLTVHTGLWARRTLGGLLAV